MPLQEPEEGSLLVIGADEIRSLLYGQELQIIRVVERAYTLHAAGKVRVPQSLFLRFPDEDGNRIIALPAYVDQEHPTAGIKWISSFPKNIGKGLPRASGTITLNSVETGRAYAVLEASMVSAWRTAASAAVASLQLGVSTELDRVAMVGCGVINLAVFRFLSCVFRRLSAVHIFDIEPDRSRKFATACSAFAPNISVTIDEKIEDVLAYAPLVSFATTAQTPHVTSLDPCPPGATILHISLRDLSPQVILLHDNVVDDPEHVCREGTSLDLAARLNGNRNFIRTTLGQVLLGVAAPRRDKLASIIFTPFGLGMLDLAVATYIYGRACERSSGMLLRSFHSLSLPAPPQSEKR